MPEVWICTSILNDRGIQGLEEMEAAGRFTTGPWGAPLYCYESVSYTHLDVYKRQDVDDVVRGEDERQQADNDCEHAG